MSMGFDKWYGPRGYEEFTVTIAAPGVVTKYAHNLSWKDQVVLATTGALPTGLSADTWYYVIPVDQDTFQLTATANGSAITTSGTQSGTHSLASDGRKVLTMEPPNYR